MSPPDSGDKRSDSGHNACFQEFVRILASIEANEKLFPKDCRTCGRVFNSFSHYLQYTEPKGHGMEDCRETMGKPYTMVYRHCGCGNTLVLTLTDEHLTVLDEMWVMLRQEADKTGTTLQQVVKELVDQMDRYVMKRNCLPAAACEAPSSRKG